MQSNVYVYIRNLYELELQIVLINNTVKLVTYTQIMLCHTLDITMLNAMLFLNVYDDVE